MAPVTDPRAIIIEEYRIALAASRRAFARNAVFALAAVAVLVLAVLH